MNRIIEALNNSAPKAIAIYPEPIERHEKAKKEASELLKEVSSLCLEARHYMNSGKGAEFLLKKIESVSSAINLYNYENRNQKQL